MPRYFILVLALLLSSTPLLAGAGRVIGTVVDEAGEPIKGVQVAIRSLENDIVRKAETNRKGRFSISLPETTLTWTILLEAEGYPPLEEPLGEVPGGFYKKTWKLQASPGGDEISPEVAQVFNEGAIAYGEGKIDFARERFEAAIAIAPDLIPAWRALGPIYLQKDENEKAIAAAEKLLSLVPGEIVGLKVLSDANEKLGRVQASTAALDLLIQAETSPEVAARVFNAGAAALRKGDEKTAISRFRQALEIDSTQQSACSALGNVLLSQQAYEEALKSMDRCLEAQPKNANALTVRFNTLRALGREEEADQAFARLQAGDPKAAAKVTYRQGEILFELGNAEEALASFRKTLDTDPDHAKAHYMVGLALVNLGENAEAKEHLARYLELDPEGENVSSVKEMLPYLE